MAVSLAQLRQLAARLDVGGDVGSTVNPGGYGFYFVPQRRMFVIEEAEIALAFG